jgi:hypothetical protein
MAISINDNLGVQANKPLDDRYGPYTEADEAAAILAANNAVPSARRFRGLVVGLNINGVISEYWYKDGVANENLVSKQTPISDVSGLQTALDGKQPAGSYATLTGGKLTSSQLPDLAISDYLGSAANQTEMLALTGQKGDWVTRTDDGKVYVITGDTPSEASSWTALSYPTSPVTSVNGETGTVTLDAADVKALPDHYTVEGAGDSAANGLYKSDHAATATFSQYRYLKSDGSGWRIDTASGGNPSRSWWRIRRPDLTVAYVSQTIFPGNDTSIDGVDFALDNGTVVGNGVSPSPKVFLTHTHRSFTGATSTAVGKSGFVPRPSWGDQDKYLKGDGTWGTVVSGVTSVNGETGAVALTAADVGALGLSASSYIIAKPGDDLAAKYTEAKALTPNGAAKSATNRASLIIIPGTYSASAKWVIDGEFVDVIGLGSSPHNPAVIFNYTGAAVSGYDGVVRITADDVRVVGISTPNQRIFLSSGRPKQVVENCAGGDSCFITGQYQFHTGTIIGCKGGAESFAFAGNTAGTYINCVGGDASFNAYGIGYGKYTDCTGGSNSFGFGGVAVGTYLRCTAGWGSFGIYNNTIINNGFFLNCVAKGNSFGSQSLAGFHGVAVNCFDPDGASGPSFGETFERLGTASADTDTITMLNHGLVQGQFHRFRRLYGGSGLDYNINYCIRNATPDTFQVSLSSSGPIVDITADYTLISRELGFCAPGKAAARGLNYAGGTSATSANTFGHALLLNCSNARGEIINGKDSA